MAVMCWQVELAAHDLLQHLDKRSGSCRPWLLSLAVASRSRTAAEADQHNAASDVTRSAQVRKSWQMITAYVLIQTEVGQAGLVASAAAGIDGVQLAQPLAGP